MFTKALFLVLLGCAIASATPDGVRPRSLSFREKRSPAGEKVAEWWHGVEEKIKNWAGKVKNTFQNLWDKITGRDKTKQTQQQLKELQDQYDRLQNESAKAVDAKKAEWDRIVAEQERRLRELKQKADEDVESEIRVWDQKFDQLKSNAEEVINSLS